MSRCIDRALISCVVGVSGGGVAVSVDGDADGGELPPREVRREGRILAVAFVFFISRRTLFAVVMCASRYGIYVECLTEIPTCLVAPIARRRQLAL